MITAADMGKEAVHRILFVCHGNICRSPMAEFVMKDPRRKSKILTIRYLAFKR